MLLVFVLLFFVKTFAQAKSYATTNDSLVVSIASGTYAGLIEGSAPNVRQWRGIPYGLPPVGERRWLPPVAVPPSNDTRLKDATRYAPSCPQYLSSAPSLWNTAVPQWTINTVGQNKSAGAYANSASEDCLYVGVWAPTGIVQKLPVIMFMTGGAFINGGIDVPYQIPTKWVQRSQAHIVVTINYRLDIIGFPGALGLDQVNVGLLDQRAALEWVRDNIAAFGGDSDRITLWGQSAGGLSCEFQSFIEYQDPIAQGYVMTSGTVGAVGFTSPDRSGSNFSSAAEALGCRNETFPVAELDCMRQVPVAKLVTVAETLPGVRWVPIQDEKTVFSNYTARYESGQFAHKPAIYSTCTNDGTGILPFPSSPEAVNTTVELNATDSEFTCPAANYSKLRGVWNKYVYRYVSSANFTNVSPVPWLGAYHFSDLAYIFGTDNDFRTPSTQYELEVSSNIQDLILAFMENPTNVPGWPVIETGQMLSIGVDGGPAVQNVSQTEVDKACGLY